MNWFAVKNFELFIEKSWNIHFCIKENPMLAHSGLFFSFNLDLNLSYNTNLAILYFVQIFYANLMKGRCLFWKKTLYLWIWFIIHLIIYTFYCKLILETFTWTFYHMILKLNKLRKFQNSLIVKLNIFFFWLISYYCNNV